MTSYRQWSAATASPNDRVGVEVMHAAEFTFVRSAAHLLGGS